MRFIRFHMRTGRPIEVMVPKGTIVDLVGDDKQPIQLIRLSKDGRNVDPDPKLAFIDLKRIQAITVVDA